MDNETSFRSQPKVSVLMSVYNEQPYIEQAVDSILSQTYKHFEFVIVDDNSNDGTQEILKDFDDPRIRYVENNRNIGFVDSLNKGLDMCDGKYVARMDGDDIARADRLKRQVRYLESNPKVGIVGSYFQNISKSGEEKAAITRPETDLEIRWFLLLRCPFGHPTVMIRRKILEENDLYYSPHYPSIEDYDLWPRVLKYTRGANIPEYLVYHRIHEDSLYLQQEQEILREHDKIALRTIRDFLPGFETRQKEVSQLRVLFGTTDVFVPYDPENRREELIDRYLDMLEVFIEEYSGRPGLNAAKRIAVRNAVKVLLHDPSTPRERLLGLSNPANLPILLRAFSLHPFATIEGISSLHLDEIISI